MVEQKPANLFSSSTFYSLIIVALSAAQPVIEDISKNGGSFSKYMNLAALVLGSINVVIDKHEKEKNTCTPKWFPFGRNPEDAVTIVEPIQEVVAEIPAVSEEIKETLESKLKSPLTILKLR